MINGKKILVFLPALNEEKGIARVFKKMPGYVDDIIVVDNGSTDRTASIAKENCAFVLAEKKRGKGFAFRKFLEFLGNSEKECDYVVMLDADDTYSPKEISLMVESLEKGNDVAVGSRINTKRRPRAMSTLNLFGNMMLTGAANILYTTFTSKDICCGYWAFKSEKLKKLDIRAKGFDLEADLFSQSKKNRYKVGVVPIFYGNRAGNTKLKVRDGAKILYRLIRNRFL